MVFSLSTRNYAWMIVFIAFILNAIAFGTMASVSMFLKPLVNEFGWTRGSLSMGYTIMTLATSVSGVLWSILVDKYGSRWIARLGAFTIGIPLILLSNISLGTNTGSSDSRLLEDNTIEQSIPEVIPETLPETIPEVPQDNSQK